MIPHFIRNDNSPGVITVRRIHHSATANVSGHPIQSAATNATRADVPAGVSERSAIAPMTRITVTPIGTEIARNIHRRCANASRLLIARNPHVSETRNQIATGTTMSNSAIPPNGIAMPK